MKKLVVILFVLLSIVYVSKSNDQDTVWLDIANEMGIWDVDILDFSPDDNYIIGSRRIKDSQSDINQVYVFNTQTGNVIKNYFPINKARYTPDGGYILGEFDNKFILLTSDSLIKINRFQEQSTTGYYYLNENGSYLYTLTQYGLGYRVFDFNSEQLIKDTVILPQNSELAHYYSLYDFKVINDHVALYDVQEEIGKGPDRRQYRYTLGIDILADTILYKLNNVSITNRGISHDGTKFCGIKNNEDNYQTFIFDINTGIALDSIQMLGGRGSAFTNDDKYLVFNEADTLHGIEIWDLTTKELKYTYFRPNYGFYYNFTISNNDEYLAAVSGNYFYLYNAKWEGTGIMISPIENELISYPNPAESKIKLEFKLNSNQQTRIELINQEGKSIKEIENKYLEEGNHNYFINLMDIPSGIYFVKIQSGEIIKTNKLIINH